MEQYDRAGLRMVYKGLKRHHNLEMDYTDWLEEQYIKLANDYQELYDKHYEPSVDEIQKVLQYHPTTIELAREALLETKGELEKAIGYVMRKERGVKKE